MAAIAKAGNQPITDERFYRLTRKDLIAIGVPPGSVRTVMREAFEGSLYNSSVDVEFPPTVPGGQNIIMRMRWVQSVVYDPNHDCVRYICFGRHMAKLISGLSREYTTYQISTVGSLKSFNAIRIFEMLSQYKNGGRLVIAISTLLQRLQVESNFSPSELRERVLDPAIKQINEHTMMTVSYSLKAVHGRRLEYTIIFLWYSGEDVSQNSEQVVVHLTRKQATHFGMILHARADFRSEWGRGRLESWDSLLSELIDALQDPVQTAYFLPWLKKCGFDPDSVRRTNLALDARRTTKTTSWRRRCSTTSTSIQATSHPDEVPLKARPSPPDRRAFFFLFGGHFWGFPLRVDGIFCLSKQLPSKEGKVSIWPRLFSSGDAPDLLSLRPRNPF